MLSIAINVKNGAKYLELCLNALYQFEDIVLLDNYSTDNTLEIAKRYSNVRVFETEFTGMGNIRNQASELCKNDWVFFVDCDEIISKELANALLEFKFKNGTVYSVFRQNYYAGKLVDSSAWENDWVKRIYNRTETKYIDYNVHESIDTNGMNVAKIEQGYIYHFPYEQIYQLLDKTQFYSTLYAKQNLGKKHAKLGMIPLRSLVMFIKCYLLKGGFRDGYEGFVVSTFNAIGVLVKYFKLYELEHQKAMTLLLDFTNLNEAEVSAVVENINQQNCLPAYIAIISNINIDEYIKRLIVKHNVFNNSIDLNCDDEIEQLLNNKSEHLEIKNVLYIRNYDCLRNKTFLNNCKKKFIKSKQFTVIRK